MQPEMRSNLVIDALQMRHGSRARRLKHGTDLLIAIAVANTPVMSSVGFFSSTVSPLR